MDEEYSFTDEYRVGDIIYYLRVMPNLGVNEIIECMLRTVESDYMVGVSSDPSKQVIMMNRSANRLIFKESKKYHVRKVTRQIEFEEE
jgi:hypothetical protein